MTKRTLAALSMAALVALMPIAARASLPVTTDEAREVSYSNENHDPAKKQAEREALAGKIKTPSAETLQSVEPAAGATETNGAQLPLTTDEARGATY